MAVDEWLLRLAADEGLATLRFYQWSKPTLTLGYFQPIEDRQLHTASRSCPVVRRASGGGAILHDSELTYSLAIPAEHALAGKPQQMYDAAHLSLIDVLDRCVPTEHGNFNRCRQTESLGKQEPLLCFLRRAKGDVIFTSSSTSNDRVADGRFKICGSAQRKLRGSVLQHGSVLLSQSQHAPELPGIEDLTNKAITADKLSELWIGALAEQLRLDLQAGPELNAENKQQISQIATKKFANRDWTTRR